MIGVLSAFESFIIYSFYITLFITCGVIILKTIRYGYLILKETKNKNLKGRAREEKEEGEIWSTALPVRPTPARVPARVSRRQIGRWNENQLQDLINRNKNEKALKSSIDELENKLEEEKRKVKNRRLCI